MKTYLVNESFGPTIQGEGKGTGEVVLFLRFAGCNKWSGRAEDKATSACPFCDTDFNGGDKLTAQQIVERLLRLDPSNEIETLVVSGGEPTLQLDEELAQELAKYWYVYVETNGSREFKQGVINFIDHVSCSPKQSPAETVIQRIDSLKLLHPPESFERGINAFSDDEPFQNRYGNPETFIQPVMDQNYEQNLESTLKVCYANPKVRLSVQLHKTLGVK